MLINGFGLQQHYRLCSDGLLHSFMHLGSVPYDVWILGDSADNAWSCLCYPRPADMTTVNTEYNSEFMIIELTFVLAIFSFVEHLSSKFLTT